MVQTLIGARKIAALRAGLTLDQYEARIANGDHWCTKHKDWHAISAFGPDASRTDGIAATCLAGRKERYDLTYQPRPRPIKGRSFVPARDGDRKQARRRINYFVDAGLLPDPNNVPCFDCGHVWGSDERRHEYDHYLGYTAEHHEHVQSVCSQCHHRREGVRRGQ